jgi:CBS domain-containing protein
VHGDRATAALVRNLLPVVVHGPAPVGLITMRDLPLAPRHRQDEEVASP